MKTQRFTTDPAAILGILGVAAILFVAVLAIHITTTPPAAAPAGASEAAGNSVEENTPLNYELYQLHR